MTEQLANLAQTQLSGSIGAPTAGTSEVISVTVTTKFPTEPQFRVNMGGGELGLVTHLEGTKWTVTRGVENTTPVSHTSGEVLTCVLTVEALDNVFATNTSLKTEEERAKAAEKKAREEAETASIPLTQKNAHSGVAGLNSAGELEASQVPVAVVTDSRMDIVNEANEKQAGQLEFVLSPSGELNAITFAGKEL